MKNINKPKSIRIFFMFEIKKEDLKYEKKQEWIYAN